MKNDNDVFDSFDEFDEARKAIREQAATRKQLVEESTPIDTDTEQIAEVAEEPVEVEEPKKKNKKK